MLQSGPINTVLTEQNLQQMYAMKLHVNPHPYNDAPMVFSTSGVFMREQALNDARTLVYKTNAGVMSTISSNLRGYPFGSVTPICATNKAEYTFLLAI
ncbi:hypothetical protein ACOBV8_18285 (plasmid) [Pseudoalteromonas espejiana]